MSAPYQLKKNSSHIKDWQPYQKLDKAAHKLTDTAHTIDNVATQTRSEASVLSCVVTHDSTAILKRKLKAALK